MKLKVKIVAMLLAIIMVVGINVPVGASVVNADGVTKYTVKFDANGGKIHFPNSSSWVESASSEIPKDAVLPYVDVPYTVEKDGKIFKGFKIDGDDTLYVLSGYSDNDVKSIYQYKVTGDVTFKAEWADAATVTYDANGADWGKEDYRKVLYEKGTAIGDNYPNNPYYDEDHIFVGYKLSGSDTIYGFGDDHDADGTSLRDYVVNNDVTFEAVWAKAYVITYDFNGGYYVRTAGPLAGQISFGDNIGDGKNGWGYKAAEGYSLVVATTFDGLKKPDSDQVFAGWKIEGDDKLYFGDDTVTSSLSRNITLVATWKDADSSTDSSSSSSSSSSSTGSKKTYANEWFNGKWYNADGKQTYAPTMTWKSNGSGWWIEDSSGWYPTNKWQKINSVWYYFNASGYMAENEWVDGWWINSDGSCTYGGVGSWKCDGYGWWYQDSTGWYPTNTWQKIDGYWYYFKSDGYMATNQYIGGYWVGADGACE